PLFRSCALAGALVFALTIVPALCAFMFKPEHANISEPRWTRRMRAHYRVGLQKVLNRRAVTLAVAAGLLLVSAIAATRLGTEFLPELDEGDINVLVEMPASIAKR